MGTNATCTDSTDGATAGGAVIDADPLFVDPELATSAPTTEGDYRLQFNSPAIDSGSDQAYLDAIAQLPAAVQALIDPNRDLDNNARVAGSAIDLGPHEFQTPLEEIFVNDTATGLDNGQSWTDAYTDLQDALQRAESSIQIDAAIDQVGIFIAGGAYSPAPEDAQDRDATFLIPDNVSLYGGFAGDEPDPLSVLDNRNFGADETILSGNIDRSSDDDTSGNSYTVVTVASGVTAELNGVTISGGNASVASGSTQSPNRSGGGIHNMGTATLISSTVTGNAASYFGGGIYNQLGELTLINSIVTGNIANFGGGIFKNAGELILINSTVTGNRISQHGVGAGIYNFAGELALINSILWGNGPDDLAEVDEVTTTVNYAIIGTGCPTGSTSCSSGDPLFIDWIDPSDTAWEPTTDGDYRLLPESPAINAGNNALYDETAFGNLDLAGNDRIVGGTIDLGAYEAQFTNVSLALSASPNPAPIGDAVTIDVAMTGANLDTSILDGVEINLSGLNGDQTITLDGNGEGSLPYTAVTAGAFDLEAIFGTLSDSVTLVIAALPEISLPDSVTVNFNQRSNVTWSASAIDWTGSSIAVTCSPSTGSSFRVGDTTVRCEATDSLGQTASDSFVVTVRPEPTPEDPRAPSFRNVPDTIVVAAVSPAGAMVDYPMPRAVDDTDGDIPVTCSPPPGSWFGIGHNTVTCSATNSLDLTSTMSFGISVAPFQGIDFSPLDETVNPWFWSTWARTDLPVRDGHIARTWMWSPGPFTESMWEPYTTERQNPGGDSVFLSDLPESEREVIYFDKARMEINDPDGDTDSLWFVTNGLLVIEMITGNRQFGDDLFKQYEPSTSNVAGDSDGATGPTYWALQNVLDAPAQSVGSLLTQEIDRNGDVTDDETLGDYGITVGSIDEVTDHGIAGPFWEFMQSQGMVYVDDNLREDALFVSPLYATGRPVTGAYWASAPVAGVQRDVLLQCFERRCLTYTPGNDSGFVVEAGNVGQHYFTWRYVQHPD